jgi:predicted nucleic acid-binding protein
MNSSPLPSPWPPAATVQVPPLPPLAARSALAQRLANALDARLRRRRGRLERLDLSLLHAVPAGAGGTTGWQLRARVADLRATAAAASPAAGLRTVDRGELPTGPGLEALWHWVLDTSALHRLVPPSLTEQVSFTDAAVVATPEVIRHRVLRSAAVLERLPASLEVKLGRRRATLPAEAAIDAGYITGVQDDDRQDDRQEQDDGQGGTQADGTGAATASGTVSVVRLVARFPTRDGTPGDLRIVVWDSERRPGLVELLRDCARRLDPAAAR